MVHVSTQVGPTFEELRPLQTAAGRPTGSTFPAHPRLPELLLHPDTKPEDGPDPVAAHVLAVLSTYAYSDLPTMLEMATRLGLEECRGVAVTFTNDPQFIRSTAYLLQSRDGRVGVLVYRGTEPVNIVNWLTDLDLTPDLISLRRDDGEPVAVHAGFYRNVRATRFRIARALRDAVQGTPIDADEDDVAARGTLAPLEALYVTGHSLGGAMAALFATLLREDETYAELLAPTLRAVYTYGQPMIGSPELARRLDDEDLGRRVFRYIYEGDPIPRLPSRDTGRWEHFGRQFHFKTGLWSEGWDASADSVGQMRFIGDTVLAVTSLPLSQLIVGRHLPVEYRIDDHLPHHYVSRRTPPGTVSEFGDHPYVGDATFATRLRREIEQRLREISEIPQATTRATSAALAALRSRLPVRRG